MKTKTSITISTDVLRAVDALAGSKMSRSAFIERVLRAFLGRRRTQLRDAREVATINRHADELNAEADDVLGYQASWIE